MSAPTTRHRPVMLREVLEHLAVRPGGTWIDGTVGGGGHAAAILDASSPDGRLLGIDRDRGALRHAAVTLAPFGDRARLVHGSFGSLADIARAEGFEACRGVLLDLGFSSDQIDDPRRGLSIRFDGPLDMRLDPEATDAPTAGEMVNELPESDLASVLRDLGEEPRARRIARAIVAARPIASTGDLARVVERASGYRGGRTHPATRTFQALRIAVNDELAVLARALPAAVELLAPAGRVAVISFHSLEDRIVKRFLRTAAADCVCPPGFPECRCGHVPTVRLVTRRPLVPTYTESAENPRSRSARLRVAERLPVAAAGGA